MTHLRVPDQRRQRPSVPDCCTGAYHGIPLDLEGIWPVPALDAPSPPPQIEIPKAQLRPLLGALARVVRLEIKTGRHADELREIEDGILEFLDGVRVSAGQIDEACERLELDRISTTELSDIVRGLLALPPLGVAHA